MKITKRDTIGCLLGAVVFTIAMIINGTMNNDLVGTLGFAIMAILCGVGFAYCAHKTWGDDNE